MKGVGACRHSERLAGMAHEELTYLAEQLRGLDRQQKVVAALYMECLAGNKLNIRVEQGNQVSETGFFNDCRKAVLCTGR